MANKQNSREQEADRFLKKYRPYMNSLDKSPLNFARSINEDDVIALGMQLEAFESYTQAIHEADGTMAALGALPRVALDAITIAYGESPLAAIASVQPIDEKQGYVYFKDFVAQTTRGNVTSGDKLFSALGAPDSYPNGFASGTVRAERFVNASNGDQTYTDVQLGGSAANMAPLEPKSVVIYGTTAFNGDADVATWPSMTADSTTGEFSGSKLVNSTLYSVFGIVNFTTGTVSLQFSANPSGQTSIYADYETNPEAMADMQKGILQLQTKTVNARVFALKTTMGLLEAFMLNKRLKLNLEEELAKDLTAAINNEIMNITVALIEANVPNTNAVTWKRQAQAGVSLFEHGMSFASALADLDSTLIASAGRGTINVLIAGRKAAAVLSTLPEFELLYNKNTFGPHIYGKYKGITVVRVPFNAVLDDDVILALHKGENVLEAPVVWAPYMPLVMTNTLPMAYNPLQQQKAVAVWGAIDTLIPNLSAKLTIDQSSFNYGAAS